MSSGVYAELKLEAVEPAEVFMGQDLEVTLTGTGFDENTMVSMYPDIGNKKAIIGNIDTFRSARDVMVSGNTAFVAEGYKGNLQIIDVSDTKNPTIVGHVDTPGHAYGVTVSGSTAFVADGGHGLQIIDVSDINNPTIIGHVDTPGSSSTVTVSGSSAFLGGGWEDGMQIIDVSDPINPTIIGHVDAPSFVTAIAVSGTTAFMANYTNDLQIIDVSDPTNLTIIDHVYILGIAEGVTVSNDTAYVASGYTGYLQIIDVSDTNNPTIISYVDTSDFVNGVTISGSTAFVAGDYGLQIIDLSDINNPTIIGHVDTPGSVQSVEVLGNTVFVADDLDGLQIIDMRDTTNNPNIIGYVDTPFFSAKGVTVSGSTAFVADGEFGLRLIDVSNTNNPTIITRVDTPGNAEGVTVSESTVFVADGLGGLQIIDVSDINNPTIIGHVDTPDYAEGVAVSGSIAFVAADFKGGIQIIDVKDPANPTIIGNVDTPGSAKRVEVSGNTAFVADFSSLQIIDVSDFNNPVIIGHVNTPGHAYDVTVSGNTAFVADWDSLQIVDVSDFNNPTIIGHVNTPGYAKEVTVSGNTAIVVDGSYGLQIIDVSDTTNPTIIGYVDTPGYAYDVTVSGSTAFVADGNKFVIVPLPVEIEPITVNSKKKISLTLPSPQIVGNYTLRVFNENEHYELPGVVRFSPTSKAIIVAGGGPPTEDYANFIWEIIRESTNHAYRVLLDLGYKKENICYLSPDVGFDADGNGKADDVAKDITLDNLRDAIQNWAKDADDLILYMIDHGGDGTFRLNSSEILRAEDLDADLDDLQETMSGRVIFIYDACESGSFISRLKPPKGKERIIITSSNIGEASSYLESGNLSFSFQFWASVYKGARLNRAFFFARDMMEDFQTAIVDANGDGISESNEGKHLSHIRIGRSIGLGSDMPVIKSVCAEQTLDGEITARLWVGDLNSVNNIQRVWAVISPPDLNSGQPDEPVTSLPTLELTDSNNDGTYEGIYKNFDRKGIYKISIYAEDTEGVFSLPKHTTVTKMTDSTGIIGDINDSKAADLADAVLALKVLAGLNTSGLIPSGYADSGADVDGDGKVGMEEVIYIIQKAARIED
ncbi:MAG: hypothetical protein GY751_19025 [Bacteroidetes bacterium]|nr:hypothetical protein [Bacteroidota bacterium]